MVYSTTTGRFCGLFCLRDQMPVSTNRHPYSENTMEIIVNGEARAATPMSMLELLRSLDIDPRRVAVELNHDILPKGEYESTILNDGDRIEIVHFVGGG